MKYPGTYWVKQVALYKAMLLICTPDKRRAAGKALRRSQRELALVRRRRGA